MILKLTSEKLLLLNSRLLLKYHCYRAYKSMYRFSFEPQVTAY